MHLSPLCILESPHSIIRLFEISLQPQLDRQLLHAQQRFAMHKLAIVFMSHPLSSPSCALHAFGPEMTFCAGIGVAFAMDKGQQCSMQDTVPMVDPACLRPHQATLAIHRSEPASTNETCRNVTPVQLGWPLATRSLARSSSHTHWISALFGTQRHPAS